jgi:hypothetical protein
MEVLKTTSPIEVPLAPNEWPVNTVPSSSASFAIDGVEEEFEIMDSIHFENKYFV